MTRSLIQALHNPLIYDHPVSEIKVIETHISWVILTGHYAYKIKKPVNFGFLDFSTLTKRYQYCLQELTLNRRLAPDLYLDLIAITGSPSNPSFNGAEEVFEYAVKMREFPQSSQLDQVLARGELYPHHMDQLAKKIADFHNDADISPAMSPLGSAEAVYLPVQENFDQIKPLNDNHEQQAQLEFLEAWSIDAYSKLRPFFHQRKEQGHIRNGHGDLHLSNIALVDREIVIFDCIEFNEEFRWIDTINDIAFTTMDLEDRGRGDLAARLINAYLQYSGDYEGLRVFNFYRTYRALVRAKVACLQLQQSNISTTEIQKTKHQYRDYTQLAEHYTREQKPLMYITHGVSGSGKSCISQPILEHFGLIRIRSDVERKRLFGLEETQASDGKIYTKEATQQTYERLEELATHVIESGHSVIIDATFLKKTDRQRFNKLAKKLNVTFVILNFYADTELLKTWITERQAIGQDPSEATIDVLNQQLATLDPLSPQEADAIFSVDTANYDAKNKLIKRMESFLLSQPPH